MKQPVPAELSIQKTPWICKYLPTCCFDQFLETTVQNYGKVWAMIVQLLINHMKHDDQILPNQKMILLWQG